jgi:hypothetical protein
VVVVLDFFDASTAIGSPREKALSLYPTSALNDDGGFTPPISLPPLLPSVQILPAFFFEAPKANWG